MKPTLLADAALALALAALYAYVARVVRDRPTTSRDADRAKGAFVTWWVGLAGLTLVGALRSVLGGLDVLHVGLHAALSYLTLPLLVAALWGLLDYLLYIYTGSPRWRGVTMAAHAALGVFFVALVAWMGPRSVTASDWTVGLAYARPLEGPLLVLALGLILVPTLLAAGAYLTLAFRVKDRTARYRIAMVSGAFLLWFGSAAVASAFRWSDWYWWPLAARGVALLATLLILAAYRPPRAVREALEVALVLPRALRGGA